MKEYEEKKNKVFNFKSLSIINTYALNKKIKF